MTQSAERYLLARVDIPATEPLADLANRLSQLMTGFPLEEELTGRFDEVPAFVAGRNQMEFVLFGIPAGDTGTDYELKFTCETDLPTETLLGSEGKGFLQQFLTNKPVESEAFFDYSEELAHALVRNGIIGCKPIAQS